MVVFVLGAGRSEWDGEWFVGDGGFRSFAQVLIRLMALMN